MNFFHVTVLFTTILVGFLAADGPPIECYQCNSSFEGEGDCMDLLDKNPATMLRPKPCDKKVYGEEPFCRKTTLVVYLLDGENKRRTYRGCGSVKHKNSCVRFANAVHAEVSCQCFENGCNSALLGTAISNLNIAVALCAGFFVSHYYK